ncbi:MAG: flavodoxin-dependent (E)-4-hydroxy-3-methylbut-2-enyl-diphosphate synthase [Actinomycetota bacterium]|nr:flavodoxin-dependent (E)-4-hydroxy-3-methylbut-2-enyl-diphosphate synthase [Actinomycetota bacterium]
MQRRKTRKVMLRDVPVGGGAPITVQSMTNTPTADLDSTLDQVRHLVAAGCDIVRVAVPDMEAAATLRRIVEGCTVPIVADIHFDWKLALKAMEAGVAGIRVNPGTIGSKKHLEEIAKVASPTQTVVRVGVNAGSLEKRFKENKVREKDALVQSAIEGLKLMEDFGVEKLKVSVKASGVEETVEASREVSEKTDWPMHVGITEAGTLWSGTIKNAVGIGALLAQGIGDTIRVSLSSDPLEEVRVGSKILQVLGLGKEGPQVVSCPTCARTRIDVIEIAELAEKELSGYRAPIRVAVMGCEVNGPGEAKSCDVGVTGGPEHGLLFVGGKLKKKVELDSIADELLSEAKRLINEYEEGKDA